MKTNEKIVETLQKVLSGAMKGPKRKDLCLSFVRQVVDRARHGDANIYYFYSDIGVPTSPTPNAAQVERRLRELQWDIGYEARQPGDIVFNRNAAPPYGHVGMLLDRDTILESVEPSYRPKSEKVDDFVMKTPITAWPQVTTVARWGGITRQPAEPVDAARLREREPVRTVVLEGVDEEGSLYVRRFSGVYTEIDNEGERKLHIRRVWGQG